MNKLIKRKSGKKAFKSDQNARNKRKQKSQGSFIEDLDNSKNKDVKEQKLRSEYEHVIQKNAILEGKPTKEYLQWKEDRSKYEYLLNLGAKLSDELEKPKTKKELKRERVSKIALEISKLFPHHEIVASIDGKGGYAVHGWLEENCEDYDDLLKNYVLDRACYYAKRHYEPEIIKSIRKLDLTNLKNSRVTLKEEKDLENYPGLNYKQVIIIADGYIENAITWIPNYEYEIDGYDVRVNLGPANLGFLGFCLWNVILCIVLHAPGKNQAFFEAKIKANDINQANTDILKKIIHQCRSYQKPLEDELDEIRRDYLQAEKKYSDLKRKVETQAPSDILQEYQELNMKYYKGKRSKSKWKDILLAIFFIIIIGLMIFLVFFFGNVNANTIPSNSTISSSNILLNARRLFL